MKLPQTLLQSRYFIFPSIDELILCLGENVSDEIIEEIRRLDSLNLPPLISIDLLSALFGVSRGFSRVLLLKVNRYYRTFEIVNPNKTRVINAPMVALKLIQKWMSFHLLQIYKVPDNIFGFVPGKSHVQAAKMHSNAAWVFSVDIKDFFPTTSEQLIFKTLQNVGYNEEASEFLARLFCLNGFLAQGAPSSPILSNLSFLPVDNQLIDFSKQMNITYTRYADDLVFSGMNEFPVELEEFVKNCLGYGNWSLSPNKTEFFKAPFPMRVHGLLVNGQNPRLPKRYRNKIRAYKHMLSNQRVKEYDIAMLKGHISYADFIDRC